MKILENLKNVFNVKYHDIAKMLPDRILKNLGCSEGAKGEPRHKEGTLYTNMHSKNKL